MLILYAHPFSSYSWKAQIALDEKGIDDVVIVGAMSHMCVDATVRAASDFGYKTTTIHDACATRDLEFGESTVPAAQVHATMMSALASL